MAFNCKVGKKVINIFDETEETFRKWSKEGKLRCIHEGCKTPIMRYAHGDYKMPYFSHVDGSGCDFSEDNYGRESGKYNAETKREHSLGQYKIADWIRKIKGVTDLQLEKVIEETNQRADIYFKYNNEEFVIEYQCSPQASKYNERHELYRLNEINDIWIFGTKKYGVEELLKEEKDNGEVNFKIADKQQLLENNRILYYNPFEDTLIKIKAEDLTLACREQKNGDITLLKNTFIVEKYSKNKIEEINNIEYLLKHEVNEEVVNYINICLDLKGGFTFKYEEDEDMVIGTKKGFTKMKDQDGIKTERGEIKLSLNRDNMYLKLKQLINRELSIENLRKDKNIFIKLMNDINKKYNIDYTITHTLYEDLYIEILKEEEDILYSDYYKNYYVKYKKQSAGKIGLLNKNFDDIIKEVDDILLKNSNEYIERINSEKINIFINKYNKIYNANIEEKDLIITPYTGCKKSRKHYMYEKYILNLSIENICKYELAPYTLVYNYINKNEYADKQEKYIKEIQHILYKICKEEAQQYEENVLGLFNGSYYKDIYIGKINYPIYKSSPKYEDICYLQKYRENKLYINKEYEYIINNLNKYFSDSKFSILYKNHFLCSDIDRIKKGEISQLEIDLLYKKYKKIKKYYNTIKNKYYRLKTINYIECCNMREGRIEIGLINDEYFMYKIDINKNIEEVYEEISTMIRNGLYPIDK